MNNIEAATALDSLRPYTDAEIPAAMRRMAADPTLDEVVAFAFPGGSRGGPRKAVAGSQCRRVSAGVRAAHAGEHHPQQLLRIHLRRGA